MRRTLLLLAAAVMLPACYRITVTHGPQPAAAVATAVEFPWQHSWAFGLLPPPEINVRHFCPAGVAKVQTQSSVLNGPAFLLGVAVGELTHDQAGLSTAAAAAAAAAIWQPMAAKVTCAPR